MEIIEKNTRQWQDGLFIKNRELSWVMSGLCLVGFALFYGGYTIAKKKYCGSLCHHSIQTKADESSDGGNVNSDNAISLSFPKDRYYAHLASFGSYADAQACANQMQDSGVSVNIKKRSCGVKEWYQVITKAFDSKNDLVDLVIKVAKKNKLRDIYYVCC